MHFSWKRWRVVLTAALTALAMSLAIAGQAVAAEPGESGSWTEEQVGSQTLAARGTLAEARNGGYLLQAWRGETNNIVWLSINNGNAFQLTNPDGSSTGTDFSPAVVGYGQNSFMVFHTGTDGNIYYTQVSPASGTWTGYWTAVPAQSTNMAVSVAQLGGGSNQLYMVYHSSSNDRVYGTQYDGSGWQGAQWIAGGSSPSAPSVTYQSFTGLTVVARGVGSNQIWMSSSGNPYNQWSSWTDIGGNAYNSPTIAANNQTGTILVSYVDPGSLRPNYRAFGVYGNPVSDWSQDITGWQTLNPVALSVLGAAIYVILTGLNDNVYYKQVFSS